MADTKELRSRYVRDPAAAAYTYRVQSDLGPDALHATAVSLGHDGRWSVSVNERIGGNGTEPTPGDLLLAALAACQTIALQMTARALGVRITKLHVEAEGDVDHRGVLLMDPAVRSGFSAIRLRVEIDADADPDRIDRLLAAAERSCAATDALRNGAPLTIERVVAGVRQAVEARARPGPPPPAAAGKRVVPGLGALAELVGAALGPGEWTTVEQASLDAFAAATGDHHWVHEDPARAARESPFGGTIAHGFLTLGRVPAMLWQLIEVTGTAGALVVGADRVRLPAPVPTGRRIRLAAKIGSVDPVSGGVQVVLPCTVEIEGVERPALVADLRVRWLA